MAEQNINNFLYEITAPVLGDSYGEDVTAVFKNINDNFIKLANKDFVVGADGKSVAAKEYKLYDNEGNATNFPGTSIEGDNTIVKMLKKAIAKNEDPGQADIGSINIFDNLPENISPDEISPDEIPSIYLIEDNAGNVLSSLPFTFIDARYYPIIENGDYSDQTDYSCILTYNGKEFVKHNAFPTLYYDSTSEQFCWRFQGVNSGLPAQGPKGFDGEPGQIFVTKIDEQLKPGDNSVVINNILDPINYNGQWIKITDYKGEINDNAIAVVFNYIDTADTEEKYEYSYWVSPIIKSRGDDGTITYYVSITDKNKISLMYDAKLLGDILDKMSINNETYDLQGLYTPIYIDKSTTNNSGHLIYSKKADGKDSDYKTELHIRPVNDVDTGVDLFTNTPSSNIDTPVLSLDYKRIQQETCNAEGKNSFAIGSKTSASGDNSHAEGSNTKALKSQSHAEGLNTTAAGVCSHIEGKSSNIVSEETLAGTNEEIIAEWKKTKFSLAKGEASHTEGIDSLALGSYSHVEGKQTIASGNFGSHAEGLNTTASGKASHAEGAWAKANGEYSHAEGYDTTAVEDYSHAEGYSTTASGDASHAEGSNTKAGGWKHTTTNKIIYNKPSAIEINNYTQIGYASHSEGYSTTATGEASHSEGFDTTAAKDYSHAEGYKTIATGEASHSEGYSTTATGENSHSEGYSTTATGENSHSEGYSTTATGDGSHAEGFNTTASGSYSHTEGSSTTALGKASHAEGYLTEATGDGSHAEGSNTTASGNYSHAEGHSIDIDKPDIIMNVSHEKIYCFQTNNPEYYTEGECIIINKNLYKILEVSFIDRIITVDKKITEDISNTTPTRYSIFHKVGSYGTYSHTEGYSTMTFGEASHAEGYNTIVSSDYSHIEGYNNHIYKAYDADDPSRAIHLEGWHNNIEAMNIADGGHVEGSYCKELNKKCIHIVGIGNDDSTRTNAHVITTDGKHYIPGVGGYDGTQTNLNTVKDLVTVINAICKKINIDPSTLEDIL